MMVSVVVKVVPDEIEIGVAEAAFAALALKLPAGTDVKPVYL